MVPAVWAGLAVILWVMTWLERRLITQPPVEAELPPPAASETRFTDARPARSRLGAVSSPPNSTTAPSNAP
jgi:hypothetical protein